MGHQETKAKHLKFYSPLAEFTSRQAAGNQVSRANPATYDLAHSLLLYISLLSPGRLYLHRDPQAILPGTDSHDLSQPRKRLGLLAFLSKGGPIFWSHRAV